MQIFNKPLKGYTDSQIDDIFHHSVAISESLSSLKFVKAPKVIDISGKTMNYEFIELPSEFVPQLRNKTCDKKVLEQIGEALACIHSKEYQKGRLVHGDFVPHNIFASDDIVYIIDYHPPELIGYRADLLYGDGNRDVVAFIFTLFSDIGVKLVLIDFSSYYQYGKKFFEGYVKSRGYKVRMMKALFYYFKDVYRMKRMVGVPIFSSFAHC